jgi:N-acetylglucosamine-6-phosphate deacetylase
VLIRGATLVLPGGLAPNVDVLVTGGRIARLGRDLRGTEPEIAAEGLIAGPGFIDVHVHGGGGHSFFRADPAEVRAYAAWAPRHGVTGFLASTLARDPAATASLLERLVPALGCRGAEPLGFHLEGPYLNPVRKGAFPAAMLRPPSAEEFRHYQAAAGGAIRQVTLAPELPGALEVVDAAVASGAVAAMGHTDATVEQARAAFARGISHVTHLFNAMRPIHQREGGPAVAALLEAGLTCELICDGAHVAEDVLALAVRLLGSERAVVVTDNLEMAGSEAATATFGGASVRAQGAAAVRDDGTLVGSLATYDAHFRRALLLFGGDHAAAFAACSRNPARIAGVANRKGALAEGMDADIVLLDGAGRVVMTVCRGEVAFDGRAGRA